MYLKIACAFTKKYIVQISVAILTQKNRNFEKLGYSENTSANLTAVWVLSRGKDSKFNQYIQLYKFG